MNFGEALIFLKQGKEMMRHGWNGKNISVYLFSPFAEGLSHAQLEADTLQREHFKIWDRNKKTLDTWVPSVSDILADDWCLYETIKVNSEEYDLKSIYPVSRTIDNFLVGWNEPENNLFREVCEKLYQMKIDFDELSDNQLAKLEDRLYNLIAAHERQMHD